jgi:hypothetical protein
MIYILGAQETSNVLEVNMRHLLVSSIVAIVLAGFPASTFAAQVVTTKTTPTVKFIQPPTRVIKPVPKSNLVSKEKGVGKQKVGDSQNDVNQELQLKTQTGMEEYTKATEMLSNVMKKESDTKDEISGNLK